MVPAQILRSLDHFEISSMKLIGAAARFEFKTVDILIRALVALRKGQIPHTVLSSMGGTP